MNWSQLKTILWLRSRLTRNQLTRAGGLNAAIVIVGTVAGLMLALCASVAGIVCGALLLSKAPPLVMMLVWDGMVGFFLFAWMIGVMAEIQRSETIELGKMFHLPVSLGEVFSMNYIASHITFSLILFLPASMGLCLGLIWGGGLWMVLLIPLVLSFVFMITAWTYCLRGWLVALMVNPRRRRNVVVGLTLAIVLLGQAPNIYIHFVLRPGERHTHKSAPSSTHQNKSETSESATEALQRMMPRGLVAAHDYVPFLWLPRGAMSLADGNVWPALFATLGCSLLGGVGLLRAYRATIRFYLGQDTSGAIQNIPAPKPSGAPIKNFIEKRIPYLSEDVSALTLAFFRSMSRAPEVKMGLFSTVFIVVALMPVLLMRTLRGNSETAQLFTAASFVSITFFGLLMQMFNHFGFDRDGFRALILSPAPRRKVLLAKNLAMAPLALSIGLILLAVVTVVRNLPALILAGAICKLGAAFLMMSMVGNLVSIWVPYRVTAGSLKPTKPPAKVMFMIMLTQFLFPIAMLPIFLPPLAGFLLGQFGGWSAPMVDAVLSFFLLVLASGIYWLSLDGLGDMLERHEQNILLVVSREVE